MLLARGEVDRETTKNCSVAEQTGKQEAQAQMSAGIQLSNFDLAVDQSDRASDCALAH
jgi:hypothetical protein